MFSDDFSRFVCSFLCMIEPKATNCTFLDVSVIAKAPYSFFFVFIFGSSLFDDFVFNQLIN